MKILSVTGELFKDPTIVVLLAVVVLLLILFIYVRRKGKRIKK